MKPALVVNVALVIVTGLMMMIDFNLMLFLIVAFGTTWFYRHYGNQ